jgi:hypothetical protein
VARSVCSPFSKLGGVHWRALNSVIRSKKEAARGRCEKSCGAGATFSYILTFLSFFLKTLEGKPRTKSTEYGVSREGKCARRCPFLLWKSINERAQVLVPGWGGWRPTRARNPKCTCSRQIKYMGAPCTPNLHYSNNKKAQTVKEKTGRHDLLARLMGTFSA